MSGEGKIFIHSAELDHDGYPRDCPFDTRRAGRTRATIESMGMLEGADRRVVAPERPARAVLERFHDAAYLDALERVGRGELKPDEALRFGIGTPDCPIFKGLYEYVTLAAGGTVTGARAILRGEAHMAFNPSGGFHHAQPAGAAGFCFINDIVLGAEELARAGKRVLFLDIDVHHGDGVQEAFYDRRDVMTISLHESGETLFPGTGFEGEIGRGEGRGYSVNVPLPVGTYDGAYRRAFDRLVVPLMEAFAPDVIMLEIGMDGLSGDPLAHLHLTNNVYADAVEKVRERGVPILATGGGGYHVENTVRGWTLCWSVLCGDQELHDAMSYGMGGVMLETTEWSGGLRDRVLLSDAGRRGAVDAALEATIGRIESVVFPIHGIGKS
jgi:acetoin utilization protein AcuC